MPAPLPAGSASLPESWRPSSIWKTHTGGRRNVAAVKAYWYWAVAVVAATAMLLPKGAKVRRSFGN